MIKRIIYLKPALIRLFIFSVQHNLTPFILCPEEWTLLVKIEKIREIVVVPTKHFSRSKYPTLQLQLPYYTTLLQQLRAIVKAEDDSLSGNPILSVACDEAWAILNKYWIETDKDTAVAIAMILDPRCKLDELATLGWKPAYICQAKTHFERIYQNHYAQLDLPPPTALNKPNNPLADLFGGGVHDIFHDQTETTRWLQESRENWQTDSVIWWHLYGHSFPKGLSKMARDYLSVPASSVAATHLFSRAGDIITKKRNRLLDSATRNLLLIKSWSGQPDYEEWEMAEERWAEYGGDT